jgi:hypothetical protein
LIAVRFLRGVESVQKGLKGPGTDPGLLTDRPGKFLLGGKERQMISFLITVSVVIAVTITVTIRIKRK